MNLSGKYPLFKGATRLPTFAGVPRTVIIATFIFCATLFMTIHLWAIVLFGLTYRKLKNQTIPLSTPYAT
ncbi:VirB3 family type IV secretion system protein [Escherichia coli]|nr:VirB3 family type IV secretion system protein [Escherichia coli]